PHALEVRPRQLADGRDEARSLAVDLLDRQAAHRCARVALDRLHRGAHDVLASAREELLRGLLDAALRRVDLDHADAVDLDWDAVRRVRLGDPDLELHKLEGEALDPRAERARVGAATTHDPVPLRGPIA